MTSSLPADKPALTIEGLAHCFGEVRALDRVDVTIPYGQFVAIVGPSGCGKSTLLRVLAGLLKPTVGIAELGDENLVTQPSRLAYLPQEDSLLPWKRALQNASIGLELAGESSTVSRRRAQELFNEFGLAGFEDAWPHELSGGMRQRVAIIRSVLLPCSAIALDEPLGALDALTRRSMQTWLKDVWSKHRRTTILVTHDIDEALTLSQRLLVMSPRPGRIVADIDVDLDRRQGAHLDLQPQFVSLKAEVLAALDVAGSDPRD